jgi:hypothetical protein
MWWLACGTATCGPEGVHLKLSATDAGGTAASLEARLREVRCSEVAVGPIGVEVFLPPVSDVFVHELLKPNQLALLPVVEGGVPLVDASGRTWTVDLGADLRPQVVEATASAEAGGTRTQVVLDAASGARLTAWTQAHVGEVLVMALDGRVLSAPTVKEPLLGGVFALIGPDDLSTTLRLPPLPPGVTLQSITTVGAAADR